MTYVEFREKLALLDAEYEKQRYALMRANQPAYQALYDDYKAKCDAVHAEYGVP